MSMSELKGACADHCNCAKKSEFLSMENFCCLMPNIKSSIHYNSYHDASG